MSKDGKKTSEQIKSAWGTHSAAMATLKEVLQEEELSELKDTFIEDNVTE